LILSDGFLSDAPDSRDGKQLLRGQVFDSPQGHEEAVRDILRGYGSSILQNVFNEWIERCDAFSKSNRSYLHFQTSQ
jgi:hypothetical protein